MKRPLFSVLICTVGKTDLTKAAIQSVIDQSFQDFEVIVTDTSGTRMISDIVDSFKDERVHFYEVPELDPSVGFDYAYNKSTGQYVLWYDDDNCLVPWAMQNFSEIIEKYHPDIVSGNHVYYFGPGNRHNPKLTNHLVALLPYSFSLKSYNPKDVLRALYNFKGEAMSVARWHSAALFASREVCEKTKARAGCVQIPHLISNHSLHPMLFAYAKTAIYDDRPLSVVGKFSSSMTQQWSNVFASAWRKNILPYKFTGVTARTAGNTISECYLRAQNLLPEQLKEFPLNFERFYGRYLGELRLIELPFLKHMHYWKEFWRAVERLPKKPRLKLRIKIIRATIFSLVTHGLRLVGLFDLIRKTVRGSVVRENPNRRSAALEPYGVTGINECAGKLDVVMQKEFGINIRQERPALSVA